jgi:hypothetical protein
MRDLRQIVGSCSLAWDVGWDGQRAVARPNGAWKTSTKKVSGKRNNPVLGSVQLSVCFGCCCQGRGVDGSLQPT